MENVFATRLKELIESSDLTYEQISEKIGLKSKGTICKYVNGKIKNVPHSKIQALADVFNVSAAWLAGFSDEK